MLIVSRLPTTRVGPTKLMPWLQGVSTQEQWREWQWAAQWSVPHALRLHCCWRAGSVHRAQGV